MATSYVFAMPRLRVDGRSIINDQNQVVLLRGFNLGMFLNFFYLLQFKINQNIILNIDCIIFVSLFIITYTIINSYYHFLCYPFIMYV